MFMFGKSKMQVKRDCGTPLGICFNFQGPGLSKPSDRILIAIPTSVIKLEVEDVF
jgi:hypothetical protein